MDNDSNSEPTYTKDKIFFILAMVIVFGYFGWRLVNGIIETRENEVSLISASEDYRMVKVASEKQQVLDKFATYLTQKEALEYQGLQSKIEEWYSIESEKSYSQEIADLNDGEYSSLKFTSKVKLLKSVLDNQLKKDYLTPEDLKILKTETIAVSKLKP